MLFAADEDFRPVSGGQYSYEIQLTPDQQTVPAAPFEIIDDMSVEENETFALSLTPGPDSAFFNYEIPSNVRIATVLIIDNDGQIFDSMRGISLEHEITRSALHLSALGLMLNNMQGLPKLFSQNA